MQITIRELNADDISLAGQIDRTETVHAKYVARYQNDRRTIALNKVDLEEPMTIPAFRAEHFPARLASWKEQIANGGALVGAFDAETLAGFIILKAAEQDGSAQITAVFVDAQHRRHGIGAQMMRRVESLARARGVQTLWLSANDTPSAVEFYFKQGFSLLSLCDNSFAPNRSGDPLFAKALERAPQRTRIAIPVVESTLETDALAQFVRDRYDFTDPIGCTFIKRGTNDTYLVEAGADKRAVLRAYPHGWRSREQIAEELDALEHLHRGGVSVSQAIRSRVGERIQTVTAPEGERHLVLFSYAHGDFGRFDDVHLFELGKSLAQIHDASIDFASASTRPPLDARHLIGDALSRIVITRGSNGGFLQQVGAQIVRTLSSLPIESPQFGFCHGDFGGFNTHVDSTGNQTHFDFDFCGFGHRAYDLAVFLWSRHKIAGPDVAREHFSRFLEGYESIRKLTHEERQAIPDFVLCREIFILGVTLQTLSRFPRRPSEDPVRSCVDFIERWRGA
jgi:Ser/Thr protein kinase RdoA (MazF antagonist)/GNAT superfamily N-acetyltransferase